MITKNPTRMVFSGSQISSYQPQASALDIFLMQNAILLDVRTIHEFARTKISNARHVALEDLSSQIELIKSWDAPVITYCNYGNKSKIAAEILSKANVNVIDGRAKGELIKLLQKKEAAYRNN